MALVIPDTQGVTALMQTAPTSFRDAEVLITGGHGFIGSNLARELVRLGARVTLVDSMIPEYGGNLFNVADLAGHVSSNICDVRDPHAISHLVQGKDLLFNLAGQTSHLDSMVDPKADLDINAGAQLSILEACRRNNPAIKVVFASTRQIYGKPRYLPADEAHPVDPIDVNGINKLAGEMYHLLYQRVHGIRTSVLRLTNVYGPGMRVRDARQTFLGVWIRNLVDGEPMLVFGDGAQRRDFNYVDDCVSALLLAGADPRADGRIYNLGGSEVVTLAELAARLASLGEGGRFEFVPFPADRKAIDIGDYYGDFSRIHSELGWAPAVPLDAGLRRTVDYYRRNRAHYWTPR